MRARGAVSASEGRMHGRRLWPFEGSNLGWVEGDGGEVAEIADPSAGEDCDG